MKKIYLACFDAVFMKEGDVIGFALCEDGHGLAQHLSSDKEWSKHDMGYTSDWKHEVYKDHCPDGFELIWIDDAEHDKRWLDAIDLNHKLALADEQKEVTNEF